MTYTFARVSATAGLSVEDRFPQRMHFHFDEPFAGGRLPTPDVPSYAVRDYGGDEALPKHVWPCRLTRTGAKQAADGGGAAGGYPGDPPTADLANRSAAAAASAPNARLADVIPTGIFGRQNVRAQV